MTFPSPEDLELHKMTKCRFAPWVAVAALVVGIAAGAYGANIADKMDRLHLLAYLHACEYKSHGISDVAWEAYRKGITSSGPAYAYTHMVMSKNRAAAKCLNEGDKAVPRYWADVK